MNTGMAKQKRTKRVQVILKIVERCNLACSYCYYFEGGDQSYKTKPAVISVETTRELASFLRQGVLDMDLEEIAIAFHGGEPLMLKPVVFDQICCILREALDDVCVLRFNVQTNGVHVSNEWMRLLSKHRVAISVSIDGLEESHDRERVDHKGRGSFQRVSKNYSVLKEFSAKEGLPDVEIIAVLDARNDYRETVAGLRDTLNVRRFNFLLPDCSHDDGIPGGYDGTDYGRVLREIFLEWQESENISVREIDALLERFQLAEPNGDEKNRSNEEVRYHENQIVVVRSDGELQIDDTFIPASEWRNDLPRVLLSETSLVEYLDLPVFREIDSFYDNTPEHCTRCVWQNICNGGDLENRYSKENRFNSPSVYCDGLRMFYRSVAKFLLKNGYPSKIMNDRLRSGPGGHQYLYAK